MPFLRNRNRPYEPIWHLQLTVLAAIGLQIALPSRYVFGSRWVLVFAEALLLITLSFTTPKERIFRSISRRINVFLLIAAIGITNSYALVRVADKLLSPGHQVNSGRELILSALNIYLTNIIVFALLYWEMDGGGPGQRLKTPAHDQDFLFPQNQNESYRHPQWRPTFIDYLYVSSTNSMAFSPTDTMPLSRRAKLLMLAQAVVSLVAIALVAARAVNILG
ncbi:MAG TPA: hypothetical protein VHA37_05440 [Candidatus Saccharimonadales bacterium]|nr:hypothetical protein [Candidatus Saccharimonadales bacterium]